MNTQTETFTSGSSGTSGHKYAIGDLKYDLMTLISEKSKGLEALSEYLQDAQGNQQVQQILQQIQQQDKQSIQQLTQCLSQLLSGQGATSGSSR